MSEPYGKSEKQPTSKGCLHSPGVNAWVHVGRLCSPVHRASAAFRWFRPLESYRACWSDRKPRERGCV